MRMGFRLQRPDDVGVDIWIILKPVIKEIKADWFHLAQYRVQTVGSSENCSRMTGILKLGEFLK